MQATDQENTKRPSRNYEKEAEPFQRELLGPRYVGKSLSDIRAPEWVQVKLLDWMKNKQNFLVYCGNPGLGKTHLCSALFPWALKEFQSFRYHNERELLRKVRESMDTTKGDHLTTLKYLIDDDLVFFDDIGSEKHNEWREDIIFDAIDQRYSNMLPTVITSNYSVKQFHEIYHPRFCSRLFAAENTIIEILDGEDHRQTINQ